jgi:hypothetical protein
MDPQMDMPNTTYEAVMSRDEPESDQICISNDQFAANIMGNKAAKPKLWEILQDEQPVFFMLLHVNCKGIKKGEEESQETLCRFHLDSDLNI